VALGGEHTKALALKKKQEVYGDIIADHRRIEERFVHFALNITGY